MNAGVKKFLIPFLIVDVLFLAALGVLVDPSDESVAAAGNRICKSNCDIRKAS